MERHYTRHHLQDQSVGHIDLQEPAESVLDELDSHVHLQWLVSTHDYASHLCSQCSVVQSQVLCPHRGWLRGARIHVLDERHPKEVEHMCKRRVGAHVPT